jgi:type 1 fimbria pilin
MTLSTQAMTLASIVFSQGVLAFSPSGPYSLSFNQATGSTLATANSTITVTGFTGKCSLVETLQVIGNEISPGAGIYSTGLNVVGVSFYLNPIIGGRIKLSGLLPVTYPVINLNGPEIIPGVTAELVVTGSIISGLLSNLPSVKVNVSSSGVTDSCSSLMLTNQTLQTTIANNAVSASSCQVLSSSINVRLSNISSSMLNAVGTSTGDTQFNIELNCQTGVRVYLTLTDATDIGNTSSLLSLKPVSTATGVKLRILKNDETVVRYGPDSSMSGNMNQWLIGSSGLTNSIPLKVQYYRDGQTIGNGSVEAAATFTLSYQ